MKPIIPCFEPYSIPLFGGVAIHMFGILVALGFLLGGNLAQRKANKLGVDPEFINQLIGFLVLGTFVGGHLGHMLFYEPQLLVDDFRMLTSGKVDLLKLNLLQVWHGLSSLGGFLFCIPVTIWFFWKHRQPFWPHADALSFGFALGWFFGRMGCFSAHDHPGPLSNFFLAVPGACPTADGTLNCAQACHDMGLYEALWSGVTWVLFELLDRKPRFTGFYVGLLPLLYGPYRFASDFLRSSPVDVRYLGLTPAQYGALVLTGLGVWVMITRHKAQVMPGPAFNSESMGTSGKKAEEEEEVPRKRI
jgi:phosphatidylglycerol:prolipoprotein diacylglycerol transferase